MNDGGHSTDSMLPLVYEELRAAAVRLMQGERGGHTLQPTALVHEAYAKLAKAGARFESELHFFHTAALAMRRVLVDHAIARGAKKRGGRKLARVELDEANLPPGKSVDQLDLLALDEALKKLEEIAPRRAQVVSLKYFAGLTDAEIAKLLGVSESPVRRDWATARAWLYQRMRDDDDDADDGRAEEPP
jgi:RNA polymerase sigma factor (TIGR02999 family)